MPLTSILHHCLKRIDEKPQSIFSPSVPHHKLLLESRIKGKGVGSDQATQRCWSQQVAFEPTSPKRPPKRVTQEQIHPVASPIPQFPKPRYYGKILL